MMPGIRDRDETVDTWSRTALTCAHLKERPGYSDLWLCSVSCASVNVDGFTSPSSAINRTHMLEGFAKDLVRYFKPGIPNLFWMPTHLTKPPRFRDTPLTVRPPPPPSTRLEKKIHYYIIKTNKANLTARFSYLIMSKAEFRRMTSDFKI
jgi:hypothetical protein